MEVTATEVAFVALVLFIGLLVYLKVPATIMGALDSKSQAIAKELHDARKLREEAEALLAEERPDLVICESTYGDRDHRRLDDTVEEFAGWQRAIDRSGMPGLRVTRIQHYKSLYERQQKY
jgi:LmbE family N-acetylglucosaminyl deacetylase